MVVRDLCIPLLDWEVVCPAFRNQQSPPLLVPPAHQWMRVGGDGVGGALGKGREGRQPCGRISGLLISPLEIGAFSLYVFLECSYWPERKTASK